MTLSLAIAAGVLAGFILGMLFSCVLSSGASEDIYHRGYRDGVSSAAVTKAELFSLATDGLEADKLEGRDEPCTCSVGSS